MAKPARAQLLGRVIPSEKNVQRDAQCKDVRPVVGLHDTELLRRGKARCSKRTSISVNMIFVEPRCIKIQQIYLAVRVL